MSHLSLPRLHLANAHFVTERVLVGGDLDADEELACAQLDELVAAGVTHILDVRIEADDASFVADRHPTVRYRHLGIDDAGQRVPGTWFDQAVRWALDALADPSARMLSHCHMGINRGPSLGFAVLLAMGYDLVDALDAIRTARPIAYIAYAEDALTWHHDRIHATAVQRTDDRTRLAHWRDANHLDLVDVIRRTRQAPRPQLPAASRARPTSVTSVSDVIRALGADWCRPVAGGGYEFAIEDIPGFVHDAYQPGQVARVSLFLAIGLSRRRVRRWLATAPASTVGRLEALTLDDGECLRFLVEVPLDDGYEDLANGTREAAHAFSNLWEHGPDAGGTPLLRTLARAGIAPPPLPHPDATICNFSPWRWGTTWLNSADLLRADSEALHACGAFDGQPFTLAHLGYGTNSYWLHLSAVRGPVAVLTQHLWGGVYSDPLTTRQAIADTYMRLHVLFENLPDEAQAPDAPPRWLLHRSDLWGIAVVDLERVRAGDSWDAASITFDDEVTAFEALVERLSDAAMWDRRLDW